MLSVFHYLFIIPVIQFYLRPVQNIDVNYVLLLLRIEAKKELINIKLDKILIVCIK